MAQECVDLQADKLNQDQINMIAGLTYKMAFEAGYDIFPDVTVHPDGLAIKVCFPGVPVDASTFLDDVKYLAEYDHWKVENDAATAEAQQKEAEAQQEMATNPFTKGGLADVSVVIAGMSTDEIILALAKASVARSILGK
jgi:hypothetical protein